MSRTCCYKNILYTMMVNGMTYEKYDEEELLLLTREGSEDAMTALIRKYAPLVRSSARALYLIGADTEDLVQEGMIGLYKAIQNYEKERDASFYTFAKLCIDRQIYSAIKASNRKKHSPLNTYVSLYAKRGEDEAELIDNLEAGNSSDPERIVLERENALDLQALIESSLSRLERSVLPLYLEGISYSEIAERLDKTPKAVDNAVRRIREKIKKIKK